MDLGRIEGAALGRAEHRLLIRRFAPELAQLAPHRCRQHNNARLAALAEHSKRRFGRNAARPADQCVVKKVLLMLPMPIKVSMEPSLNVTVVFPLPSVTAVPATPLGVSVALFSDTRSPPS
jgi:hypothetical protein